jgi:hypothetical protein
MEVRHVLRRGNLLIARAVGNEPARPVGFICECEREDCFETATMTPMEFAAVTAEPGRFVVLVGHEETASEEVVAEGPGYAIVEARSDPVPACGR